MEQEHKQSQGEERSYRVLELHLGNQVNQFTASLNNLIQNPCLALPAQARTAFMRCLMFRVLCRAGAAVQQLLTVGHRAAPFPLFGALWGMLTSLDELPPCQRDELIYTFQGDFPRRRNPERRGAANPPCMCNLAVFSRFSCLILAVV